MRSKLTNTKRILMDKKMIKRTSTATSALPFDRNVIFDSKRICHICVGCCCWIVSDKIYSDDSIVHLTLCAISKFVRIHYVLEHTWKILICFLLYLRSSRKLFHFGLTVRLYFLFALLVRILLNRFPKSLYFPRY